MSKDKKNNVPEKILRIGIIRNQQIISERLILPGRPVTIGTASDNLFQVDDKTLSQRFTLFNSKDNNYFMYFVPKMKVRLKLGKNPHPQGKPWETSDILKLDNVQKKGENYILPLDVNDKGSVNVGEYRFVFQFIDTPPIALRALNVDYESKYFNEEDKIFFSFLGFFTALAITLMIYVINTEPSPLVTQEEMIERFSKLLETPPEPEVDPDLTTDDASTEENPDIASNTETTPTTDVEEKPPEEVQEAVEAQSADNRENTETGSENMSNDDYEEATNVVRSTALFQMLATRGEGQGTVSTAFGEGAETGSNLDERLQGVTNGNVASASNQQGTLGQSDGVNRDDVNIGSNTAGTGGNTNVASAPAVAKVAPKGSLSTSGNDWSSSSCPDVIKGVVKSKSGGIKYCYEAELKKTPDLKGRVVVALDIQGGSVSGVDFVKNTTGNKNLESCISRQVKRWKFGDCDDYVDLPFALSPSN